MEQEKQPTHQRNIQQQNLNDGNLNNWFQFTHPRGVRRVHDVEPNVHNVSNSHTLMEYDS